MLCIVQLDRGSIKSLIVTTMNLFRATNCALDREWTGRRKPMQRLVLLLVSACLLLAGVTQAAPANQEVAPRPQITSFTSTATAVDPTALNNRTARIPVSWTISNRPNSANLVFEQVLPDGRVVNVELPRDNPWVASNGNGVA